MHIHLQHVMFILYLFSAQAYASLTNNSFPLKYSITFLCSLSKLSSSNGILISPHQTESFVILSFTINLSFGDLPVNSPVLIFIAPVEVKVACPFSIAIFAN